MLIDSHTHIFEEKINFEQLDLSDIAGMIVPSYSMQNLSKTIDFCNAHDKCYCALGVYPQFVNDFDINIIKNLFNKKVYAIGEIGLDTNFTNFEKQIAVFTQQVELAQQYDLPISVHLRGKDAFNKFFDIMSHYSVKCALHCFCGDKEDLARALDFGYYISFAGNITYKGNIALQELAKKVPLNQLLVETDAPNMLPAQFGRKGINSSENLHFVVEKLADIKNVSVQEIEQCTFDNANKLFKLKL